jgi:hypothetical protein
MAFIWDSGSELKSRFQSGFFSSHHALEVMVWWATFSCRNEAPSHQPAAHRPEVSTLP